MIHIQAFYKGKLITEEICPETITTKKEAITRIINTLYWNHISCTIASEKNWYDKFEYILKNI